MEQKLSFESDGLALSAAIRMPDDMAADERPPSIIVLHVSGRDKVALEATIAPWRNRQGLNWQHGEPSLEYVFIELMTLSKDNFQ